MNKHGNIQITVDDKDGVTEGKVMDLIDLGIVIDDNGTTRPMSFGLATSIAKDVGLLDDGVDHVIRRVEPKSE